MKRREGFRSTQADFFGLLPEPASQKPTPLMPTPTPALITPNAVLTHPSPPPLEEERPTPLVFTVGELTRRIKSTLETRFTRVWVRGEISGYRGPNPRGHLYFSLKDADACIDVCVWASTAQRLRFQLKDGLSVVADGNVDVYAPRGRYSLVVQKLEPEGEGALALAFQQLKERLSNEGLMGEKRSRPPRTLPFLPRRIGVVTSRTGAALQDFLRVLHGRHPALSVLLCDARVQGDGAAEEVCRALERLARTDVDVIVVTRGGGSLEDLWTFNEESVARAIFNCPVPVVSAIGHEIDFTIADFVADFRAPTPSAAAERLAPVLSELWGSLRVNERRLAKAAERLLLERRGQLTGRQARLQRLHPQTQLAEQKQRLHRLEGRLQASLRQRVALFQGPLRQAKVALVQHSPRGLLAQKRQELAGLVARLQAGGVLSVSQPRAGLGALAARLEAMSPLAVMARGYSMTFRTRDGRLVRTASDVAVGESLRIRLADCQTIDAQVTRIDANPAGQD